MASVHGECDVLSKSIQFVILFMANVLVCVGWHRCGSCQMLLFDTTRRRDCTSAESFCASAFKRICKRETIMRSTYTRSMCFRLTTRAKCRTMASIEYRSPHLAELHSYGEHTHPASPSTHAYSEETENSAINFPFE